MSAQASLLFKPVELGSLKLPTRLVMAPMTRNFSPKGVPTDQVVEYYRRRAAAGVGLIISEGTTVPHCAANGYPNVPQFHGEEALAGFFFSSRRRHTRSLRDWSSDVCSSD